MKILKPHPEFYKKYKDKTLQRDMYFKGIVVGYFIDVDGSVVLIVETDNPSNRPLHYLIYQHNVEIKDYHGNHSKEFFLVTEEYFKRKIIKVI